MSRHQRSMGVGIIGCGRVAVERHLPPLLHRPEVRVVATADLDRARAARLAGRLGAAASATDYRAVLERRDVDAVAVLTPTASHAEVVAAALDAGKHVLVEKPLALSLADCDRLAARAEGSPCKVVVGLNLRWHRLVRRARELLVGGGLGRVKAIRSAYTHDRSGENAPAWHRELAQGGGVSLNEAVHHFDLWRLLGGGEVEEVFSYSRPSRAYEDETSVISARLDTGALITGVFSFRTGPTSEVELYAEEGRLALSLYRFDGLELFPTAKYPGDLGDRARKALASLASLPPALPALRRGGDFQATFDGLWGHFAACVLDGAEPESTLEDGRRSVAVALAAVESARLGAPVAPAVVG